MDKTYFFSLVDKKTQKEVYTSPAYVMDSGVEAFDWEKIFNVFRFYFDRVNSGIEGQINSPKTPPEVKANLKYLEPNMFEISYRSLENYGGYSTKIYWTKNLNDFSDIKTYTYNGKDI